MIFEIRTIAWAAFANAEKNFEGYTEAMRLFIDAKTIHDVWKHLRTWGFIEAQRLDYEDIVIGPPIAFNSTAIISIEGPLGPPEERSTEDETSGHDDDRRQER